MLLVHYAPASNESFFLLQLASYIETDGHIQIEKRGGTAYKTLVFYQCNEPFQHAIGQAIHQLIPGVSLRTPYQKKCPNGTGEELRYSTLVYRGDDTELILEKTHSLMIWKGHKAHWMSISGTEATYENVENSKDYSDDQTEWDLTDYGGAQGILNDWGYDGT